MLITKKLSKYEPLQPNSFYHITHDSINNIVIIAIRHEFIMKLKYFFIIKLGTYKFYVD